MMSVAITIVADGDADSLDAQVAFHLAAGATHAVVAVPEASSEIDAVLQRHTSSGSLHVTRTPESAYDAESRTRMARFAAAELGADWVVNLRAREFWWPRAESLGDALVAIPPRYTIVQGLVRRFVVPPREVAPWERQTTRESLLRPGIEPPPPGSALRAVHRALPDVQLTADGQPIGRGHVPLRGWYPLEVLTFRRRGDERIAKTALEQGLADGSLTDDDRLQRALEVLRTGGRLEFHAPDVVDDATYAVECAAVGEVDTTRLIARLDELEARIAELEQGLRARVVRRLSRLAGGGRR
jgi:hypothetical protein